MPSHSPFLCRHCAARPGSRRRGLCPPCYRDKGIRRRYAPTSKYAPLYGDHNGGYRLPRRTNARPGSREKLAELARRAKLRQSLHHPEDPDQRDIDWEDL